MLPSVIATIKHHKLHQIFGLIAKTNQLASDESLSNDRLGGVQLKSISGKKKLGPDKGWSHRTPEQQSAILTTRLETRRYSTANNHFYISNKLYFNESN